MFIRLHNSLGCNANTQRLKQGMSILPSDDLLKKDTTPRWSWSLCRTPFQRKMTNLQNAISCLDRLNNLELDYLKSLVTARMSHSSDVSLLLRLPRELRDRIYYFAAAEFLREWPPKMTQNHPEQAELSGDQPQYHQKFHGFEMVNNQIRKEYLEVAYGSDLIKGGYLDNPKSSDWKPIPSKTIKYLIKHPVRSFNVNQKHGYELYTRSKTSAMEGARLIAESEKFPWALKRATLGWPRNPALRSHQYCLYGYLEFPSRSKGPQFYVVRIPYLQLYEFGTMSAAWKDAAVSRPGL